jgi:hypothetical protein
MFLRKPEFAKKYLISQISYLLYIPEASIGAAVWWRRRKLLLDRKQLRDIVIFEYIKTASRSPVNKQV